MCCISLACNIHRDTLRVVDQCPDRLLRRRCAKNTVRYLENDPTLTCPQCTVRIVPCKVPLPTRNLSCENEEHLVVAAHDNSDLEKLWPQDDVFQPFPSSKLQISSSAPPYSRPASTQFDFQLTSHIQSGVDDFAELSHEDGIRLIEEMYGTDHLDYSIEEMDTSEDEVHLVPVETHCDLGQKYNMIEEIEEIMQNDEESVIGNISTYLEQKYGATQAKVNDPNKTNIQANIFEAKEVLYQAQQELDELRHSRQELESDFLWYLKRYTTLTQISVDSRF